MKGLVKIAHFPVFVGYWEDIEVNFSRIMLHSACIIVATFANTDFAQSKTIRLSTEQLQRLSEEISDGSSLKGNMCKSDEVVLSNCLFSRNAASMCGQIENGKVSDVTYRYGGGGKVGLEFPGDPKDSQSQFRLSKMGLSGTETHISFSNNGFKYIIYGRDGYRDRPDYGLAVIRAGKVISNRKCVKGTPFIGSQLYKSIAREPFVPLP